MAHGRWQMEKQPVLPFAICHNLPSLLSKLTVRNVAHKGLQFIQFRVCELIDDAPFPSRSGHLGAAREAEKPTQRRGGGRSFFCPSVSVPRCSRHAPRGASSERAVNANA